MTGVDIFSAAHILDGSEGDDILNATKFGITINGYGGNVILNGERGHDTIYGGAGDDILNGGGNEGKDTLIGGLGNDSLKGAAGDDTYIFNVGDGQDRVTDSAGDDNLEIHADSYELLWFSQQGNDLAMTLAGSDDSVMVANWYSNDANQIEEIIVGDLVLLNTQVDQLVSAMASFDVPSGVGNVIPQETKDALQPMLVCSWQESNA
jgi:Ca2+-binding RTX toxin-like protein